MYMVELGAVTSGTLRTDDLLEAFADLLDDIVPQDDTDSVELVREAHSVLERLGDESDDSQDAEEEADDILSDLMDKLNEYAPPYAYFGAHPGDPACFGYWLSDSLEEDFDGLKVDDLSEVPEDYVGEVLMVNDHGNVSLYVADCGSLECVWAVV